MNQNLFTLLKEGTSPVLAVNCVAKQLKEAGFEELEFSSAWGLTPGGKYYMKHHDTTLFAFTLGERTSFRQGFRMAAAHTDYPCLRIKPNPDVKVNGYAQVNVEVYGGPILNTWQDRPLGLSGRVAVKSDDVMHPDMRYVNVADAIAVLPNLAIHMNREVNKGVELNPQTQMLPILATQMNEDMFFLNYLANLLQVEKEDILDYELCFSCLDEPKYVGLNQDMILSPRLDNLTSVQALTDAIIQGKREDGVNVIALFDHEEVGSESKQGASSQLLYMLLEKIGLCMGRNAFQVKETIYDSFILSADVAHALHPNYSGKMDPTTKPVLNGGFCIKEACAQTYATDCGAVAVVEQLCKANDIPYQKFVNRSDVRGGSTLGALVSSIIPVPTVDIGVPMLAMHSAVETMGTKDQEAITRLVTAFFSA